MEQKASVFRSLYHHFGILELNEQLRQAVRSFPGAQEGDHVLVYGYIDRSAGLTLEVLATGHLDGQRMSFFNLPDDCRLFSAFPLSANAAFCGWNRKRRRCANASRKRWRGCTITTPTKSWRRCAICVFWTRTGTPLSRTMFWCF